MKSCWRLHGFYWEDELIDNIEHCTCVKNKNCPPIWPELHFEYMNEHYYCLKVMMDTKRFFEEYSKEGMYINRLP